MISACCEDEYARSQRFIPYPSSMEPKSALRELPGVLCMPIEAGEVLAELEARFQHPKSILLILFIHVVGNEHRLCISTALGSKGGSKGGVVIFLPVWHAFVCHSVALAGCRLALSVWLCFTLRYMCLSVFCQSV